mgnify:CR=1 FL=1
MGGALGVGIGVSIGSSVVSSIILSSIANNSFFLGFFCDFFFFVLFLFLHDFVFTLKVHDFFACLHFFLDLFLHTTDFFLLFLHTLFFLSYLQDFLATSHCFCDFFLCQSFYQYNASGSINFELAKSEQTNIVTRILLYAGVVVRDPSIIQVASQQVQADTIKETL